MREIRLSGSEGGAGQTNVPFLPLSGRVSDRRIWTGKWLGLCRRSERRLSCAAKRQHPLEWETPASFGRIRAENLK